MESLSIESSGQTVQQKEKRYECLRLLPEQQYHAMLSNLTIKTIHVKNKVDDIANNEYIVIVVPSSAVISVVKQMQEAHKQSFQIHF